MARPTLAPESWSFSSAPITNSVVAVGVGEIAIHVGDRVAVVRHGRCAGTDLWRRVPGSEQTLEAVIAARLGRQAVGRRARRRRGLAELDGLGVGAYGVALGAVHRDTDVVRDLRVLEGVPGVGVGLGDLRRVRAEDRGQVARDVLQ